MSQQAFDITIILYDTNDSPVPTMGDLVTGIEDGTLRKYGPTVPSNNGKPVLLMATDQYIKERYSLSGLTEETIRNASNQIKKETK